MVKSKDVWKPFNQFESSPNPSILGKYRATGDGGEEKSPLAGGDLQHNQTFEGQPSASSVGVLGQEREAHSHNTDGLG